MKNKKFLLGLLLLLGVGFAAVSTTLLVTGNVNISTNNDDFNVVFTKAIIDETYTSYAIKEYGKKITFGTKDLSKVGDISKLDFEVTNNSEMYDAEVSINCSATGTNSSYYQIIPSGTMTIAGKTKGTGTVQVKLIKASVDNIKEEITCNLSATAIERTTKAEKLKYIPKYFAWQNPTTSSPLDYTTLKYTGTETQAKVFAGLDADGSQRSVCIVKDGSLECFKNNNYNEEKEHQKEVFGEGNCTSWSGYIICESGSFSSVVYSNGAVEFDDRDAGVYCRACEGNNSTVGCYSR